MSLDDLRRPASPSPCGQANPRLESNLGLLVLDASKDREMAREATVGLLIWDGESGEP